MGREGAVHCARGGRAPHPHGLIPDESEGAGRSCNPQPGRVHYF